MSRLMNSWIVVSIALVLGATTFLYVAHLGAGGHAGECEVCDLAANASAVESPTVTVEADTVLIGFTPGPNTFVLLATTHSTAPPRAPPIS